MLHVVPSSPDPPVDPTQVVAGRLAAAVVRSVTGAELDLAVAWDAPSLEQLGCPSDLADDLAAILDGAAPSPGVAGSDPAEPLPAAIDLPSPAIEGLSPLGDPAAESAAPAPAPRGWRRWARPRRG